MRLLTVLGWWAVLSGLGVSSAWAQVVPVKWEETPLFQPGLRAVVDKGSPEEAFEPGGASAFAPGSELFVTIPAWGFVAEGPANWTTAGARYCDGGWCLHLAGVDLPQAARIVGVELEACDFDTTWDVNLTFSEQRGLEAGTVVIQNIYTGAETAVPGCSYFIHAVDPPHVVNSFLHRYVLSIAIGTLFCTSCPDIEARFLAVRVYYEPAPSGILDPSSTAPYSVFP